ncbi:MAG: type II toxin-antitoxin system RelE/ParE family toxin [Candidatus Marinimicrobia bacterium]|jgi:plasmid stabilization system protein ParE|nr:type II toxin-antitoxin system RelE/ParE family toxin [Candidatus Neomarinimicrobiota bacterium]MBT3634816.1 type II toxin-antitoxin system RelE/ParE family toxin [Candidatus Neomarinimicrobiota bacterium]MBT3683570.1 type II toxin-antitoxin system RelE/ParE family toxin [Candidatus Neomarinimicrobiota bacterium]MBT3760469.1 type II toxin-antitoxin system RelE/ParE family toxin [Candidatus Neomarinimicrobiota bacterium]MBT3896615.1 type II toxin-antitoxin system RelE/ParE family toxin [Candi
MRLKIIWSPLSVDRLKEIIEFINLDNPGAADIWVSSLFKKVDALINFPESGRFVPELKDNKTRELIFGNYRIIYSIETDVIRVLTIRNTRQDELTDSNPKLDEF